MQRISLNANFMFSLICKIFFAKQEKELTLYFKVLLKYCK